MAKPGAGKRPRSQREVFKYGRSLGGEIRAGGRHMKIVNPKTGASVPVPGPGDIASGTLQGIMKSLAVMFVLLIPVCLFVWLIVGLGGMY